jgi:hypothetical protein
MARGVSALPPAAGAARLAGGTGAAVPARDFPAGLVVDALMGLFLA